MLCNHRVNLCFSTYTLSTRLMVDSMYTLNILRSGWSKVVDDNQRSAACTITLLRGTHTILIDPGSPWDTEELKIMLDQQGLHFKDVDYVVCTHEHVDHLGSLHHFVNAIHVVGTTIYKDGYINHDFSSHIPYELDPYVKIIHTPGHTPHDVSVIAKHVQPYGRVVVAGDLFECVEDLKDPHIWQNSSWNHKMQAAYRAKVLEKADFIVPGHGTPFKVTEEIRHSPYIDLTS
ncbi:hypothetical protein P879_00340 [Paragonimus westermani]|uniref:Metallo-beta-lactamase domain-containing protein 1 n=1 Tax=Paragonimus westermani TaxID=34504 RepID=A0A8T0DXZ0_9TREM|nr:hypothetical protein P879_00340 [Paragonimus westermani]